MAAKSLSEILGGETRFGRLTVLREAEKRGRKRLAVCRCDCGEQTEVFTFCLTKGTTTSCGCLHRERAAARAAKLGSSNSRHGESAALMTPEYRAWRSMRQRCGSPTHDAYANYGGRGIFVCDRWEASFEAFLADMGRRPSPSHSLDREDNDGPYSPGNCRWATQSQQNGNRRPFKISR
jgi:hypothetical protein